jgi:hypothetical protein
MKIKNYIQFLNESFEKDTAVMHEYSIYDWFEDLKKDNWNPKNIQRHKIWTEHFIGEGWWDKISNHVDNIFKTFEGVNMNFVNDVLVDVWDQFENKEKSNYLCVFCGSYKDKDKVNEIKWSGRKPIMELTQSKKDFIILSILIDIVSPTLFIRYTDLRTSKEQEYVTDEKWQCQNFNIDNYSIKSGMEIRSTKIFDHTINEFRGYSPEVVLSLYQPGIVLNIGGWNDSYITGKFTLQKVEELMDEVIPLLEEELDIEEVIWDDARSERKFSSDTEVYDYDVKILLKMP